MIEATVVEARDVQTQTSRSRGSSVARNLAVLYGSQFLTGLLSLLPISFVPTYLGAVGLGKVTVATSIASLFSTLIVMGTTSYFVREIARDNRRVVDLLPSGIALRAGMALVLLPIVGIVAYLARYSPDTRMLVLLMYAVITLRMIGLTLNAALQGLENMTWRALSGVAHELVVVGAGWLVLSRGGGAFGYVLVLDLASLVELTVNLAYFVLVAPFRPTITRQASIQIVQGGMPFLLWAFLQTMHGQTSSLLLSKLGGEETVGWFGTANQFIVPLFMIPSVVITVLLPQFSQLYLQGTAVLQRAITRSVSYMTIITVPLAFGLAATSNRIIDLFNYPATFQNSVPVLRILAFQLLGTSLMMVLATALVGMNRERAWARVSFFSFVTAIVLNGLLIPVGQRLTGNAAIGAAIASLLVDLLMLGLALQILGRQMLDRQMFLVFGKTLLAGAVMAGIVLLVPELPLAIVVLLGGIVYVAIVAWMRVLAPEDVDALKSFAVGRWRLLSSLMRARFSKR